MSSISALKTEFEAIHAAAYADGKTDAELEEPEARRSELFGLLLEEGWAAQAPPKSSTVSFVEIPKPAPKVDFDALIDSAFLPGEPHMINGQGRWRLHAQDPPEMVYKCCQSKLREKLGETSNF